MGIFKKIILLFDLLLMGLSIGFGFAPVIAASTILSLFIVDNLGPNFQIKVVIFKAGIVICIAFSAVCFAWAGVNKDEKKKERIIKCAEDLLYASFNLILGVIIVYTSKSTNMNANHFHLVPQSLFTSFNVIGVIAFLVSLSYIFPVMWAIDDILAPREEQRKLIKKLHESIRKNPY